ncbi:excisionase [Bifidobacterium margollesii]|uniref:Excisionase n=1 Tax=Bifidobacterium margollesii TaxID=2020964 RepID=A0A2N5J7I9_9BIFI|nr:helix-turn-helix domain-containing protein [Bifidobacterium margollesii]PLS30175.1 excisionase [Bifidobacterium margollesii]
MDRSRRLSALELETLRLLGMEAVPRAKGPAGSVCLTTGDGRVIPLTDEQIARTVAALAEGDDAERGRTGEAEMPDLITTGQAARLLGVTAPTVRRLLESGAIPYVRYAERGRRMVSRRAVLDYRERSFGTDG